MYIPTPPDEEEEIGLAPIDADLDRTDAEAQAESARLMSEMVHEKGSPTDSAAAASDDVDVNALLFTYVNAMHQSKLDDAQSAVKALKRAGSAVRGELRKTIQTSPPTIQGIPDPLVAGFLKMLLDDLG